MYQRQENIEENHLAMSSFHFIFFFFTISDLVSLFVNIALNPSFKACIVFDHVIFLEFLTNLTFLHIFGHSHLSKF